MYPIIGFNVIEEALRQHSENSQVVSNIIQQSFPSVHHTHVVKIAGYWYHSCKSWKERWCPAKRRGNESFNFDT